MRRRVPVLALLLLGAAPGVALAQRGDRGATGQQNRAQLEADVRRGFARAVRQQVGLTDAQMTRLSTVTERFARDRRTLQNEERSTRISLQQFIRGTAGADSARIESALQQLVDIQLRRVRLNEAEQRELAAFMSPLQRAKFMALQEQVRRRVEQQRGRPR
ncbi:MAG: Spy/CpxP family protein refolding chaperone [Gemmatimonadaceae bacterium]